MNFSKKLSVVAAAIPFLMVVGCDSSSSGESTVAPTPNEVEEPSVKDSSNVEPVEKDTVEKDPVATDSVDTKPVAEQGSSSSVQSANESSSSARSSTPSASEEGHCFDIWNGADGIARIATGYDAGSENSGYWYTYNDNEDGGKSTIKWAAEPDEDFGGLEPVLEACGNGVCGTFELVKGNLSYDPYVGIGFDIAGKDKNNRVIQADISDMGGLVITYSSTVPAILELSLGDEEDAKIGYALPAYELGKSAIGKTVRIPWSKFAQPGWVKGDQEISMNEAVKKVASVNVRFQAKDGTKGEFNIMGIEAYNSPNFSNCPVYVPSDPIPPKSSSSVVPPSSSSVEPKSSSSLAPCNFENWNGADGVARISTGYDAGFGNSGYWYFYNDSLDGGKSIITWAAESDEYGGLEPVLEACATGICGSYTLDKGSLDYDPFVVIAFDLAGKDADGRAIPVDASGMGGIRIDFSVTTPAVLELSLGDEMDKKIGYALPAYDLGKASVGKTVNIPWSKFRQPSWARSDQLISMDEAIKSIASIQFKIQAKSGSAGNFEIMSVGSYR